MHLADLNGRIYERRQLQQKREMQFCAWSAVFCVVVLALLLFWR